MRPTSVVSILAFALLIYLPDPAYSLTDEERCHVRTFKDIGNFGRCLARASVRETRRDEPPNFLPCDIRFDAALESIEVSYPDVCGGLSELGLRDHLFAPYVGAVEAIRTGVPVGAGQNCGNGILEGDEDCEWGILDETCQSLGYAHGALSCDIGQCTHNVSGCDDFRLVFVTSTTHHGDVHIDRAGDVCQARADNAGLSGRYMAWMSATPSTFGNARDRLTHSSVPYVRTDGVMVALDWDELVSGTLRVPISVDEHGTTVATNFFAWTGTHPNGTETPRRCLDWINGHNGTFGMAGDITSASSTWSESQDRRCNNQHRIYCVEQDPAP